MKTFRCSAIVTKVDVTVNKTDAARRTVGDNRLTSWIRSSD